MIDLMATWCGPCIAETDRLRQLYKNYDTRGVVIMSIDIDPRETDEAIRSFKEKYGYDWIFVSGPDVGTRHGVVHIPTLYIIDPLERIAYKSIGVTPYSTLAAEIDKLSSAR